MLADSKPKTSWLHRFGMGTIRVRVLVTIILVTVLVAVAASLSFIVLGFSNGRQQIVNQLEVITFLKETKINNWTRNVQTDLAALQLQEDALLAMRSLLGPTAYRTLYEEQLYNDFTQTIELTSLFTEIFLLNLDGDVVFSSDKAQIGNNYSQTAFFQDGLNGLQLQTPSYSSASDQVVMYVAMPVRRQNSEFVLGVLAGRVNMDKLNEIILEQIGDSQTGVTYYLVDSNNILLTGTPGANLGANVQSAAVNTALAAKSPGRVDGPELYNDYRDAPVIGVYHWLPQLQAVLLTEQSQVNAFQPIINTLVLNLIIALLALILAIAVGIVIARTITNPLISLTTAVRQIAAGDFNLVAKVEGPDEISELGHSFNAMTDQLRDLIATLEQRVAARTQRLEIVAAISERLTPILGVEELSLEVVNQIKENFGYYHAHIYLLDPGQENLVVAAGTGEAGVEMKAAGHSIPVKARTSLVARAAQTGEVVGVDNVREAADWLPNPLLPNTYSEMAVPVVLEGQVVGVLDVQQDKIGGLDEGDAALLRSLANQVAIGIRNAQQFEQVQAALAEAHEAQQRYIPEAWDKTKIGKQVGQHLYVKPQLNLAPETQQQLIAQATQQVKNEESLQVVSVSVDGELPQQSLMAPINFRGERLGVLQLHAPDRVWAEDDLAIVQTVLDQVAQTAENLRLFEETRGRAGREQVIREITDKMRSSASMEQLVTIATEELGKRLGVSYAELELGLKDKVEARADNDSNGKGGNNG